LKLVFLKFTSLPYNPLSWYFLTANVNRKHKQFTESNGKFLIELMKQKPVLDDLDQLRDLISELQLGDSKSNEYIKARWLKYIEWWDDRARRAKKKYQRMRSAVIIAGALIPALVGLRELKVLSTYEWIFAVSSIAASLVVAICAGLDSFFNYGDIWREKRKAVEIIKVEGFSFFQLTGDYKKFRSHYEALKTFTENVEKLIKYEIKDYIGVVTPKSEENSPPGQEPLNKDSGVNSQPMDSQSEPKK
jgi:hypothetical protein